jgi:hypothetical protein
MPRVVPSQVVELIDKLFPEAARQTEGNVFALDISHSPRLAAIMHLVEKIPDQLITVSGAPYSELVSSIAAIRTHIEIWQSQGRTMRLLRVDGLRDLNPVTLIRQALAACPDEFPAPGTSELTFIPDGALRESLRRDISAANQALANGGWKAATVLAGSVIEALLLWALQQHNSASVSAAVFKLGLRVDSDIEKWGLHAYIEVAAELHVACNRHPLP